MGATGRQYWPLDEINGWRRSTWSGYRKKTGANERGLLDGKQQIQRLTGS